MSQSNCGAGLQLRIDLDGAAMCHTHGAILMAHGCKPPQLLVHQGRKLQATIRVHTVQIAGTARMRQ